MNELLSLALEAHGGLERWKQVQSIKMEGSITGAIWYVKNKPAYLQNVVITRNKDRARGYGVSQAGQANNFRAQPDRGGKVGWDRRGGPR